VLSARLNVLTVLNVLVLSARVLNVLMLPVFSARDPGFAGGLVRPGLCCSGLVIWVQTRTGGSCHGWNGWTFVRRGWVVEGMGTEGFLERLHNLYLYYSKIVLTCTCVRRFLKQGINNIFILPHGWQICSCAYIWLCVTMCCVCVCVCVRVHSVCVGVGCNLTRTIIHMQFVWGFSYL